MKQKNERKYSHLQQAKWEARFQWMDFLCFFFFHSYSLLSHIFLYAGILFDSTFVCSSGSSSNIKYNGPHRPKFVFIYIDIDTGSCISTVESSVVVFFSFSGNPCTFHSLWGLWDSLHTCMMRMYAHTKIKEKYERHRAAHSQVLVVEKIFARIQMFGY